MSIPFSSLAETQSEVKQEPEVEKKEETEESVVDGEKKEEAATSPEQSAETAAAPVEKEENISEEKKEDMPVEKEEDTPAEKKEDTPVVETVSEEAVKGEKPAEKEPDPWKIVGNATLTPCGHAVISQVTDDNRAAVLLVASFSSLPCRYP